MLPTLRPSAKSSQGNLIPAAKTDFLDIDIYSSIQTATGAYLTVFITSHLSGFRSGLNIARMAQEVSAFLWAEGG
jgi:hypothetical protein